MIIFETGVIIFIWKTISALWSEMMAVLSDRQLKKLAEHKYKRDGDYTLLEPYLQPFWNYVVEKCPLWWAPNAITFVGLLINAATALLIIFYNPDNMHQAPAWAHIMAALGVFIYQTMDSIDGKQARRTNSSSPLGELFDHGCDAVSTVVLVTAALIHCHLDLDHLMFLVCGSYMAFYLAHWVTYCTGALSFGKFDVVELQFLMMLGFLISAIFGEDIWRSDIPMVGVKYNMVLVAVILISGAIQALSALHIIFVVGGVGRNGSTVADTSVVFPALPILTVVALTVMIAKKSELSGNIYQLYPCLYLFAFGFVFAKVTCKLIVAHMCKSEVHYWDSVYFGPALLFMNQYIDFFFPEYYVLWLSLAYNVLNLIYYAHAVSKQICQHLGIYCFTLSKPPSAQAAGSNNSSSGSSVSSKAISSGSESQRAFAAVKHSKEGMTTRQRAVNVKSSHGKKTK